MKRAERSKSMAQPQQNGFLVEYLSTLSKDEPLLYNYFLKEASARGLY